MWWHPMSRNGRLLERIKYSDRELARLYRLAAKAAIENPYESSRAIRRERAKTYLRIARGHEKAIRG